MKIGGSVCKSAEQSVWRLEKPDRKGKPRSGSDQRQIM